MDSMLPTPGYKVDDKYEVAREIGVGGMGLVYEVRGLRGEGRFAMKLLRPDLARHEAIRERFRREARIQSIVAHPNIARVYDLVECSGVPAIVMEYLEGRSLGDWLNAERRFSIIQVRDFARCVVAALREAHRHGVVHRDLKPDNVILLEYSDGSIMPRLIDFGVAKIRDEAKLTVTDAFVGTYRYASPEQVRNSTEVDGRSDLYSLGVMLWELLTNELPYGDESGDYNLQNAVLHRELGALPAEVPARLAAIVRRLLMKELEFRYQTADEVLAALDKADEIDRTRPPDQTRVRSVDAPSAAFLPPVPLVATSGPQDGPGVVPASGPVVVGGAARVDGASGRSDPEAWEFQTAAWEAVHTNRRATWMLAGLLFAVGAAILAWASGALGDFPVPPPRGGIFTPEVRAPVAPRP